ncbi:MAG: exodeoxyribonuclease VII small subunit [Lachnospirales bacterium]
MATKKQIEAMSYEKRMDKLNEIVNSLESSDLSLDKSIKLYKEGVEYINAQKKSLEAFEQEIIHIKKSSENV